MIRERPLSLYEILHVGIRHFEQRPATWISALRKWIAQSLVLLTNEWCFTNCQKDNGKGIAAFHLLGFQAPNSFNFKEVFLGLWLTWLACNILNQLNICLHKLYLRDGECLVRNCISLLCLPNTTYPFFIPICFAFCHVFPFKKKKIYFLKKTWLIENQGNWI